MELIVILLIVGGTIAVLSLLRNNQIKNNMNMKYRFLSEITSKFDSAQELIAFLNSTEGKEVLNLLESKSSKKWPVILLTVLGVLLVTFSIGVLFVNALSGTLNGEELGFVVLFLIMGAGCYLSARIVQKML